jgi:hypothetical protein
MDLKQAMTVPETREDARALLTKLRQRRDLFATIEREIDAALRSALSTVESHDMGTSLASLWIDIRSHWIQREEKAFVGAAGGIVVGAVLLFLTLENFEWPFLLFPVSGGLLGGALGGFQGLARVVVLCGIACGWFLVAKVAGGPYSGVVEGGLFGAPVGAILGAIGVRWLRGQRWWGF